MKKKSILCIIVLLIFVFSIFKIVDVLANESVITIKELDVAKKSDTAIVNNYEFEKNTIKTDVTFYSINDYITYKVTILNNDDIEYTIKTVEDNNKNTNITYKVDYNDKKIPAKGTQDIYVTATYSKEIEDISERVQEGNVEIELILEDIKGEEKETTISVNSPKTGDNIYLYFITGTIALILLIILISKNSIKKTKSGKHHKTVKFFSIILFGLLVTPTIVKASSNIVNIELVNKYNLKDKLIFSYDVNGEVKQKIVRYNTKIDVPEDVEKDGYLFKGWYTSPEGGKKITSENIITEDLTYYAQFDIINYNISYNLNDGQASNPETYTVEDEIILNNPEKQGYTFSGWTGSNGDALQTKVTINKGSIGDKEYNANYSPNPDTTYKVIHKQMDITGHTYEEKDVDNLKGATDTVVKPETKTYEGFKSPELQELTITPDGNAQLVYEYEREQYELKLENTDYIDLENSTTPDKYYYDTEIHVKAKDRPGYTFTGWNNGEIDKEISLKISSNITLKPEFEAKTYEIIFDANTGTGTMEKQTITYDEETPIKTNTFTKEGYTFDSWNTKSDGLGTSYSDNASIKNLMTEGTITLYAQYTPNTHTKYTVIHELMTLDGTYEEEEKEELYGTTDTTVTPETKSYTGFETPDSQNLTISGDGNASITYKYARKKFELKIENSNSVDFTVSTVAGKYYYGKSITLKAKDISGKMFSKWSNGDTNKQTEFELTGDLTIEPIYFDIGYFKNYNISSEGVLGFGQDITYFGQTPEELTLVEVQEKGAQKVNDTTLDGADIYAWVENNKLYWWSEAELVYFHPDMQKAFYSCTKLETVDLTNVSTETVKDFASWFCGDVALTQIVGAINTSGLQQPENDTFNYGNDTSNNLSSAQGFSFMFADCKKLTSIDLSQFDTTNAVDMKRMFSNCEELTSLDLSTFDTSNVKSFYWMFRQCKKLENLDLSSFNTSSAESMFGMFVQSSKIKTITLGEQFDTSNVVRMTNMFYGLSNLETIYAKVDFDKTSLTNSTDMFNGTTKLVGAKGSSYETPFTNSYKDATYAQIAQDGRLGYFTSY